MRRWLRSARRRLLRWDSRRPVILQASGELSPVNAPLVFVAVCGPNFNQAVPSAGVTYRLGLCRGFEKLGIPFRLVSVFDLDRDLADLRSPICFISGYDYQFLSASALLKLKHLRHFVWVDFWFDGSESLFRKHDWSLLSQPKWLAQKILSSVPEFVFTPVTKSGLQFYANWERQGATLLSLPLACDTAIYGIGRDSRTKFEDVLMAFVGGYWPYKARQFDRYLKPYENSLTVFGYSPWPYAGYGGVLSAEDEAALFRQARLCPAINEPHAEVLGGDICERVFKVLGCGGMCITDATQAHRDIFSDDELLVPSNLASYHELVQQILKDESFGHSYRAKGYEAVMQRHTYVHRALQILHHFGLSQKTATSSLSAV